MQSAAEAWKKMVLRAMPPPAWLSPPFPENDVVISSRVRVARNLAHHRFPHHATDHELREIREKIHVASEPLSLTALSKITEAERDFLLGCRLISPDFETNKPGRLLLVNNPRSLSIMVNEEDHLRVQGLTAGWSHPSALQIADTAIQVLGQQIEFARSSPWGYLTSSPFNSGPARRDSALAHLVGLAQMRRLLPSVETLRASGLIVRGIFGESSRAVGAFFQISSTSDRAAGFVGAIEYLMDIERSARAQFPPEELNRVARQAIEFAVVSRELEMADAFRVLAYVRWACAEKLPGFTLEVQQIDHLLSTMEVNGHHDPIGAARERANTLRNELEPVLSLQ